MNDIESIRKVKEERKEDLLDLDNVLSVGVGKKRKGGKETIENSVIVGVKEKKDEKDIPSDQIVPKEIGGKKTDVQEIGEVQAPPKDTDKGVVQRIKDFFMSKNKGHASRHRPVPLGVSIAHEDVTAGTSSFILVDDEDKDHASSNNHVLADMNRGDKGDSILQPGPYDEGTEEDKVDELDDYVKVEDGVTVDLAWSKSGDKFVNNVLEIEGVIGEPKEIDIGKEVIKSGRTTSVTRGKVKQKHVSVNVKYGDKAIRLEDQIITDDMSDGGDSGSAVFQKLGDVLHPVALLFAGSDRITVMSTINNVEKESGMRVRTSSNGGSNGNGNGNDDNDDNNEGSFLTLIKTLIEKAIELLKRVLELFRDE